MPILTNPAEANASMLSKSHLTRLLDFLKSTQGSNYTFKRIKEVIDGLDYKSNNAYETLIGKIESLSEESDIKSNAARLSFINIFREGIDDRNKFYVRVVLNRLEPNKGIETSKFDSIEKAKNFLDARKGSYANERVRVSIFINNSDVMLDPNYFPVVDMNDPKTGNFAYGSYYLDLANNAALLMEFINYQTYQPNKLQECLKTNVENGKLAVDAYFPYIKVNSRGRIQVFPNESSPAILYAIELADIELLKAMLSKGFDITLSVHDSRDNMPGAEPSGDARSNARVIETVFSRSDPFIESFCSEVAPIIKEKNQNAYDMFLYAFEEKVIRARSIEEINKYLKLAEKLNLGISLHTKHKYSGKSFLERIIHKSPTTLISYLLETKDSMLSGQEKRKLFSELSKKEKIEVYKYLLKPENVNRKRSGNYGLPDLVRF